LSDQRRKADALRELHRGPRILVLANAWDVVSARLVARLPGCRAVATTSAGIAWGLGYSDGQRIPRDEMLAVVERIARAVDLPVTADLEAGYGDAGGTAEAAIASGAVGLNLEDAADERDLLALPAQCAAVEAVRAAGESLGVPLVINARTDVYLAGAGESEEERFELAVERLNAYLRAGADCAFAPGVTEAALIGRLVEAVEGPLSVLAGASTPPVAELEALGVRRVSVGSGLTRAALAAAAAGAAEVLEQGTFGFARHALAHANLNELVDG
jgi:2-methylisocitrate lyase-like PEP mutase family enzyme